MSYPIQVSNIAAASTEKTVHDFFSFCGTINKIDFNDTIPKTATIFFDRVSAAKTALMLNGGALDGANLVVTSEVVHPDTPHPDEAPQASGSGEHHIHQEDKPRSGIAAEYLAKGYVLSDSVLQKAIEMDQKNGISQRFLSYIHSIDQTIGSKIGGPEPTLSEKAINTAKSIDEKQGITVKATSYYEKALASPFGRKVFSFYSSTSKQVFDIHEEARRIADQHKASGGTAYATTSNVPVTAAPTTSA